MVKTVLIVDDDPTQRRLLQAVIEKQGFRAETAESGEAALEQISRGEVDVALLEDGIAAEGRVPVASLA